VTKRNAQDKVNEVKKMLENKVPKISTILIIGTTIPQLYFVYKMMLEEYESYEFFEYIKKGVDWVNYSNAFFTSIYFGLEAIKFYDRRNKVRKHRPQLNFYLILIPLALSLFSLSFHEVKNKNSILPTVGADMILMGIETKSTIDGVMPYWLFNIKYRLHIFTIINLGFFYWALKNMKKDLEKYPEKYQVAPL